MAKIKPPPGITLPPSVQPPGLNNISSIPPGFHGRPKQQSNINDIYRHPNARHDHYKSYGNTKNPFVNNGAQS